MVLSHSVLQGLNKGKRDNYYFISCFDEQDETWYRCQRSRLRRPITMHQQNMHDFADGRKNMNDIFNNHVCSASHMRSGLHFQNV